jgi:hypothetical protein
VTELSPDIDTVEVGDGSGESVMLGEREAVGSVDNVTLLECVDDVVMVEEWDGVFENVGDRVTVIDELGSVVCELDEVRDRDIVRVPEVDCAGVNESVADISRDRDVE